jgi:multidrug efflux pump subunit AcrB
MWIVELALKRPYTFVVVSMFVAILGFVSISRMAIDIFPFINLPVVSVIWSYSGLPPIEVENRITTICERAITTVTSDIDHIESSSLQGLCIIKIYLHQGGDVGKAVGTIAALCQTLLKTFPPGMTPPLITSFSASDVPILQLGLGSKTLSESELYDFGLNFIRTQLSSVPGVQIPLPYGGKQRQVMVDLDPDLMSGKGLSPNDVVNALNAQSIIIPSGTVKIGETEYAVQLNNSPQAIETFNNLPLKVVNGATIYMRDVATVHDGYAVQTNIVDQNGRRSTLINCLKAGGASTISVVKAVRAKLPEVLKTLPPSLHVTLLSDQSVFVAAAVNEVVREAVTAATLTALFILLILGSWRSTCIVAVSIPLSILASITCLNLLGQTINTMTLGGLSLAVGMLVDDATVEVENIHRNMALGKHIEKAILDGAQQIAVPTFVSTISICIVFIPVIFLNEPARSLFVPLGLAVIFAMMASYFLSRTLVPVMARYLLVAEQHLHSPEHLANPPKLNFFGKISKRVDDGFNATRDFYTDMLHFVLHNRSLGLSVFVIFYAVSFCLLPFIGEDFFPAVDAGQMRLHIVAPTGTRIEETERTFHEIEDSIHEIIPDSDLEAILDNIGLPTSGINLAYGDNITMSNFDGEILISLKEEHKNSTFYYSKELRKMLSKDFPQVKYFFQPADIVSQILNAGLPAPIDIQILGKDKVSNYKMAQLLREKIAHVPGAVDVVIHQVVNEPQLKIDVDRSRAGQLGFTERDIANSLLTTLSSSFQVSPNFWVNPANGVNYNLATQTPTYKLQSIDDIMRTPFTNGSIQTGGTLAAVRQNGGNQGQTPQILNNLASVRRGTTYGIVSHYRIQNVYDIYLNIQDRDLGGVTADINKIIKEVEPKLVRSSTIQIRGQADSMNSAFSGLLFGMAGAVVLVYLLLVINFQSWMDPLIILMAIPGAGAGILWGLFATQTTFSVPALMGAIMSIGVASANSILMITFANEQMEEGQDALTASLNAGHTRFRPVVMTASAMIIGMLPMAIGMGEGGAQNAPLGRAVIGGLLVATTATLLFVPNVFSLIRGRDDRKKKKEDAEAQQRETQSV